jgi:hypothetical protein
MLYHLAEGMADGRQLELLLTSISDWNKWREADTRRVDLREGNLNRADLSGANLFWADLQGADLSRANLTRADLNFANLEEANLEEANLRRAGLGKARLGRAYLRNADLVEANLCGVDLHHANLIGADLSGSLLSEADFSGVAIGGTVFGDVDLRRVKGLAEVVHRGPSTLGIDSVYRSRGKIPENFLRGVGVPDNFIVYMESLTGAAFQFYSCFISYSSDDQTFAERLYADLQANGVRCWFAPKDMKIGDRLRVRIDESIRLYEKLLLVLSETSVRSAWVEQEVESAISREMPDLPPVLFPIRLDETVLEIDTGWPALIKRTRHIGDFTGWRDHDLYQTAFARLMRDLKAEPGSRPTAAGK